VSSSTRSGWLAPVTTFALLVLGTAAVAIAATLALSGRSPEPDGPADARPVDAPAELAPTPSAAPSGGLVLDSAVDPVAELADPAWVARTARAAGIPERALAAYAGAALAAERSHPGCGLGWNTLAAIGLVESEHGTVDGATLDDAGNVLPAIIGVPLDGNGVAKVSDTDHGELDGDTTWDRAVGPMQFIPATWTTYATDGNGDGDTDIHNIDDAALSAAAYLCSASGDLTQPDHWVAAISAYNADTGYLHLIAEAATGYAAASGQ